MSFSSGKGIRVFTAANEAYLDYARALENSIKINWNIPITIFTINCEMGDDEYHIPYYHDMKKEMIGKFSYEAAYCMRFRAQIFPSMLRNTRTGDPDNSMVFWIDADSIVRNKPDSLIAHIQDCNVTAKQKGKGSYASGVFGIDSSALGFAVTYQKLVSKDEHWKSDQRNIPAAIKIHRNTAIFKPLPEIFCDTSFTDEGVIWTSKIKCHENEKWLKEYEYYLSLRH